MIRCPEWLFFFFVNCNITQKYDLLFHLEDCFFIFFKHTCQFLKVFMLSISKLSVLMNELKYFFEENAFVLSFPAVSACKESAYNVGDLGSIPGLGRSPGEENGYPLQYSDLENPMDCIVHGVTKSWTRLSNFHFLICFMFPLHCEDCFCVQIKFKIQKCILVIK